MLFSFVFVCHLIYEQAKKQILMVLNGGTVQAVNTPWWRDLCREFTSIASQVATCQEHKALLDHCRMDKGPQNLNARTMSAALCNVENKCLEQLYTFLKDEKCVPDHQCSLIFDGLMIPKTLIIKGKTSSAEFLKKASNRIYSAVGYKVDIKVKEFDEAFNLPEDFADDLADVFVINQGDDLLAADEFVRRYRHRLIHCKGRTFWESGGGVYTDDSKRVHDGVLAAVSRYELLTSNLGFMPDSLVSHLQFCGFFL